MPELELYTEVEDRKAQENFDRLRQYLQGNLFTRFNGTVLEYETFNAVTSLTIPHLLSFQPTDAWLTYINGSSVTINYDEFDPTNISVTTAGATRFRMVVGSFLKVGL